jgi:hypothetical protein
MDRAASAIESVEARRNRLFMLESLEFKVRAANPLLARARHLIAQVQSA